MMTEQERFKQNLVVLANLAELAASTLLEIAGNDMADSIGEDRLTKRQVAAFSAARLNNTVLAE